MTSTFSPKPRIKLKNNKIELYSEKHNYTISLKSYEVEMNYVVPDSIGESLIKSFCDKEENVN